MNIRELFYDWSKLKYTIHKKTKKIYFKEREIWWTSLGQNIGFEQNGKNSTSERPVLILKKFNHDLCWIIPFTSKIKNGKYYCEINYKDKKSYLILSQLKLISSKRLLRKVLTVNKLEFNEVRKKIKILI